MSGTVVRFLADRDAYVQSHVKLAAFAMAAAMLILWLLGDPHIWTGAVAGLAAIALRGWYMASEQLSQAWELQDDALVGPMGQRVPLAQIATLRSMASFVQVVTTDGHKHLIRYQADPAATIATIEKARP